MLKLRGGRISGDDIGTRYLRVAKTRTIVEPLRFKYAYIVNQNDTAHLPRGYAAYLTFGNDQTSFSNGHIDTHCYVVENNFDYLKDDDVIKLDTASGRITTYFRANSSDNFLLLTEKCNHYCLMCSQPPKNHDDGWIADDVLNAVPLFPRDTRSIGITGGEPTLLGDKFFQILRALRSYLPDAYIHILSNGRAFLTQRFVETYANSTDQNVCIGIPIYSDNSSIHDYIVQADGAFSETIQGILNLKRKACRVEIRVVVTNENFERLPELADFIVRNLTFIDHIAIMGLEITGFAKANLSKIWVDPVDYRAQLSRASTRLRAAGMNFSIYNHQLCTVNLDIWDVCRKSISDWKNEYAEVCQGCGVKDQCGGFFETSTMRRSRGLKALQPNRDRVA